MTIKKSNLGKNPVLGAALALAFATLSSASMSCVVGEDGELEGSPEEKSLEDHVNGNYIAHRRRRARRV